MVALKVSSEQLNTSNSCTSRVLQFPVELTMTAATKHSLSLLSWATAVFLIVLAFLPSTHPLQSSQAQTLLRIQKLLGFPGVLSSWSIYTDFCNIPPSSSLTVVCYGEDITQLHIIGNKESPAGLKHGNNFSVSGKTLPQTFSIDSFFTTLARLPNLKVLTLVSLGLWGPLPPKISRLSLLEILNISSNFFSDGIPQEISLLRNLQTLILDDNMFTGSVSDWVSTFPVLSVLSLKGNSLNGSLPSSLKTLESLRVLSLSSNHLSGEVPDISSLTNLQVLDLGDNYLGPQFPILGNKLVTIILRKNRFSSGIPSDIGSYYQLQRLDISFNRFMGPFLGSLFSLPSIHYLNLAGNKLTGTLSQNISCNPALEFVDISSNLLSGSLPRCLISRSRGRVVRYARNCLVTSGQYQHPYSFCLNEALAAEVSPHSHKKAGMIVLLFCVLGGVIGGIALLSLWIVVIHRRLNVGMVLKRPPQRLIAENPSTGYTSKLLTNARYISQSMMLGALGLPSYRTFSLEEIEEATDNFDTSMFMGDGSHGQMYRGRRRDGSLVAIRCLKLKGSNSPRNFMNHIELIAKLRHRHLVSALGHCFECYLDDSSVSRIFLVFEYVPNGTLRGNLSEQKTGQTPTWTQRISVAIGVAKGIQFLHTGIVPGIFGNNLKITNILLDQNLVAKISSYDLPVVAENMGSQVGTGDSISRSKDSRSPGSTKLVDRLDIYDFGVILLEIIVGRPISSQTALDFAKDELQLSLAADHAARRNIVDPKIRRACSDESLKTVMEICIRCLSEKLTERPSIEDVLWNLQFAAQVQDSSRGSSGGSEGSVASPFQHPGMQLSQQ